MTPAQFQQGHGEWLKSVLMDPKGQALMNALTAFQPAFSRNEVPHLYARENGMREGFEQCIRAMVMLSTPVKPKQEVEANYGIKDGVVEPTP